MDNGAENYRRFLEGDNEGLKGLVDDYYKGLCLYLNLFMHNLDDAEEIAEETLYILITERPAFDGRSGFKTWLYAIGRNTAIRYIRKRSRETTVPEHFDVESTDVSNKAEQEVLKRERDRLLRKGLENLREDYRQVLWLRYYEEMDTKSIAGVMHKTVHSVEHLLRRAKDALRKELGKEGITDAEFG
jgi:RNA polymerase sigma-70 factor (ECF subfamily)